MSGHEFDEKSLERALRAPGSPAELSGEGEYLAMFRAEQSAGATVTPIGASRGTGRRAARRLGTSSTLAMVFAVATAGVAAAYSSNLPSPVQRAVHSVLAPLGVPAAEPRQPVADPEPPHSPEPTPAATSSPSLPSPSVLPPPARVSDRPTASSSASVDPSMEPSMESSTEPSVSESTDPTASESPSPSDSPSATPTDPATPTDTPASTPSPTDTATTTPAVVAPAAVSISSAGAGQKVAPGGTAIVSGRVTGADGSPVADVRVVLQAHGSAGWRRLAVTRSAADGSVAVASGPVTETTVVRLRAQRALSAPRQLVVQPTLTATATTGDTVATIAASSDGGRAGEQVLLRTWRNGRWVTDQRGRLDAAGGVRFDVPVPAGSRVYVVRLVASATHAVADARVTVTPPPTSVTMP